MKFTLLTLVSLFTILLSSCEKPAEATTSTSNSDIKVDLLFENDGVKVYRFNDAGRSIYYTDARGRTEWTTTQSTGKSSTSTKHSVETAE